MFFWSNEVRTLDVELTFQASAPGVDQRLAPFATPAGSSAFRQESAAGTWSCESRAATSASGWFCPIVERRGGATCEVGELSARTWP